jgi:hypothetical protein
MISSLKSKNIECGKNAQIAGENLTPFYCYFSYHKVERDRQVGKNGDGLTGR